MKLESGEVKDSSRRKRKLSDISKYDGDFSSKRRREHHRDRRRSDVPRKRRSGEVQNKRRRSEDEDVTILEVITLDSPYKVKKRPRSFFSDTKSPPLKKCIVDLTETPLPSSSSVIDLTGSPDSASPLATKNRKRQRDHPITGIDLDLTPELPSISSRLTPSSSNSSGSSQRHSRKTLFQSLPAGEKTRPLKDNLVTPMWDQLVPKEEGASSSGGPKVDRRLADLESDVEDSDDGTVKTGVARGSVGGEAAMAARKATEIDEDVKPKVDLSLLSFLEESSKKDSDVEEDSKTDPSLLSALKQCGRRNSDVGGACKRPKLDTSLMSALNECCSEDISPRMGGASKLPSPSLKQPPHPVSEQSNPLLSDMFQPGWKGTPIQEVRIIMAERGLSCVQVILYYVTS